MFSLPNTPVNTVITVAVSGVLTVTAYFTKKSSEDRQHLVDTFKEMKQIDATSQATMLNSIKELTTKTLV